MRLRSVILVVKRTPHSFARDQGAGHPKCFRSVAPPGDRPATTTRPARLGSRSRARAFAGRGLDGVRMSRLAKATGPANDTFYAHFKARD
jgi:Bacterial regulatory proteins, tetR family